MISSVLMLCSELLMVPRLTWPSWLWIAFSGPLLRTCEVALPGSGARIESYSLTKQVESGPGVELLEYAAEGLRRRLGVDTLSVSCVRVRDRALRTLVNIGVLGPGEHRRPAAEYCPLDAFPAAAALVEHRWPYLFASGVPADFASASLEARLEKTSQAGVPLLVGGRVWGELWVASTRTGLPLECSELPLISWAGTRIGAIVEEMLGEGMILDVSTARPVTASRP